MNNKNEGETKITIMKIMLSFSFLTSIFFLYYTRYYYIFCKNEVEKFNKNKFYYKKMNLLNMSMNSPHSQGNSAEMDSNYILTRHLCSNMYREYKNNYLTSISLDRLYSIFDYFESNESKEESLRSFSKNLKRISMKSHNIEGVLLKFSQLVFQVIFLFFFIEFFTSTIFTTIEYLLSKISKYLFLILSFLYFFSVFLDYNILDMMLVRYLKDKVVVYIVSWVFNLE